MNLLINIPRMILFSALVLSLPSMIIEIHAQESIESEPSDDEQEFNLFVRWDRGELSGKDLGKALGDLNDSDNKATIENELDQAIELTPGMLHWVKFLKEEGVFSLEENKKNKEPIFRIQNIKEFKKRMGVPEENLKEEKSLTFLTSPLEKSPFDFSERFRPQNPKKKNSGIKIKKQLSKEEMKRRIISKGIGEIKKKVREYKAFLNLVRELEENGSINLRNKREISKKEKPDPLGKRKPKAGEELKNKFDMSTSPDSQKFSTAEQENPESF